MLGFTPASQHSYCNDKQHNCQLWRISITRSRTTSTPCHIPITGCCHLANLTAWSHYDYWSIMKVTAALLWNKVYCGAKQPSGEVGNFVANLLQYLFAKNYQNIMWFDKVIAKIKRVQFFAPQYTNNNSCNCFL